MTELLSPITLYAETHFRFGGWTPSALFRREPEIVFDLPRRLGPGEDLPVALLINDAHRYPVNPVSVSMAVSRVDGAGGNVKPVLFEFDRDTLQESIVAHPLKNQMLVYVLTIPRAKLPGGEIFVNACLRYQRVKNGVPRKKINTVLNDNLATSTKFAFRCMISDDDYPGGNLCDFGDLHCHSQFSRSHVEWGPPIEVIGRMAAANGLRFVAVTDHSYDLACDPDDYLRQDRDLRMWEMYKSSVNGYRGAALIIPSEEISVVNSKGKVVHLCGLGISEYIPGSLDGARKNVHFKKQLTIAEAAGEIERQGGVSFAAHAGSRAGIFQGVFLRRGVWGGGDLCAELGGVQAVNSDLSGSWARGKKLWVSMLQKGRRVPILAGSDAHGDFNRYRAIGIPFLQIYETSERYMGFMRTGVYGKSGGVNEVIGGIKNAATFITNGPFVTICGENHPEVSLIGSKTVDPKTAKLSVRAQSTGEFGRLNVVKVIMWHPGMAEEKVIIGQVLPPGSYEAAVPIPADELPEGCYLRVEAYGKTPSGSMTTAATGACFIGDRA
jgi:hypothetical protein